MTPTELSGLGQFPSRTGRSATLVAGRYGVLEHSHRAGHGFESRELDEKEASGRVTSCVARGDSTTRVEGQRRWFVPPVCSFLALPRRDSGRARCWRPTGRDRRS